MESPAHTTDDPALAKAIMKQKFVEEEKRVLTMVPELISSISLPLLAVTIPQPEGECIFSLMLDIDYK